MISMLAMNETQVPQVLQHDEMVHHTVLAIDGETMENDTVTIRDRDTAEQKRVSIEEAQVKGTGLNS